MTKQGQGRGRPARALVCHWQVGRGMGQEATVRSTWLAIVCVVHRAITSSSNLPPQASAECWVPAHAAHP